jgi:hypothetical protein
MKHLIFILLLISLFQTPIENHKRYSSRNANLEDIIDALKKQYPIEYEGEESFYRYWKQDNSNPTVDLDDQVDIKLWNELNAEDIKNMPKIDNYSSEAAAAHWLKWYLRLSQRYGQVRLNKYTHSFFILFSYSG